MNDALKLALEALERVSERDPQSDTCGSAAPDLCENGCIGCISRAALSWIKCALESDRYTEQRYDKDQEAWYEIERSRNADKFSREGY